MTEKTGNLIATLEKELSIIKQLIDSAHTLRNALSTRDGKAIQELVAKRQTAIMQLQMVQHAKTSILKKQTNQRVTRTNVRSLIMQSAPSKGAKLLDELESALVLLHQLNRVNERLLDKYRATVHSYNHLIDMALGVEQTYDMKGSVKTLSPARLEHRG